MMFLNDAAAGFFLGLGLIMAIGAQNVFVIQQGLRHSHVFAVCLTCALSDALLIALGVGGFQIIADAAPWVEPALTFGGALFLFIYGCMSAARAIWPEEGATISKGEKQALSTVLVTCLALTFLNPHVYLDTVVLIGAVSTHYDFRLAFAVGAMISSFTFFFSLGYGARRMAHVFESPKAWRVLDSLVAIIMWSLAAKLVLS